MLLFLFGRSFRRLVCAASICAILSVNSQSNAFGQQEIPLESELQVCSPEAVSQLAQVPLGLLTTERGVIVVDSDEESTADANRFTWEQLQDSPDKVQIAAGTTVPIVVLSSLTSKHAKVGDRVEARLKTDMRIAGRIVAARGSTVLGHVSTVYKARRLLAAELQLRKRWMRANGAIGLQFDEIVTNDGHLKLDAVPATKPRIIANKNEGRLLGVNKKGQIASPLSVQLKHQGLHMAARAGASAGGVFTMGALPVLFGLIGAADPSFAFMHPVGKNVRHRRLKGFGMGFVSGLPGGFIIADYLIKGVEAEVKPGDEFLVALKQNFTGEAMTSAALIPGSTSSVTGEVLTDGKKAKKRKKRKQKVAE